MLTNELHIGQIRYAYDIGGDAYYVLVIGITYDEVTYKHACIIRTCAKIDLLRMFPNALREEVSYETNKNRRYARGH